MFHPFRYIKIEMKNFVKQFIYSLFISKLKATKKEKIPKI